MTTSQPPGDPVRAPAARRIELGAPVHCRDGVLGELADIVVDPNPSRVSHLVVHAAGGGSVKRLIPYDLVDDAGSRISLRCTLADAHGLAEAQELEYLPSGEGGQTLQGFSEA